MMRRNIAACLGFVFYLAALAQGTYPPDPDIPQNIPSTAKWENIRVKYQPPPPKPIPKGQTGTVVVQCKVGSDGLPTRIKAIQGPDEYYEYSEAYISKWVFYPATLDGKPVATWFKLSIPFKSKK
jgi:hypothetical protein